MKAAADQDVPDTHRKTASFLENEKVYFLLEQKKLLNDSLLYTLKLHLNT